MPYLVLDDKTKIYYEETGKDKKETVLIIHGLGSSHLDLMNFINEFKPQYHVVAMIKEDIVLQILQKFI